MGFKINFTEPSLEDLAEVADYSDLYFPTTPETMAAQLVDHIELLSTYPRLEASFSTKDRIRKRIHSPFSKYHKVFEPQQRIDILYIWHGSRRRQNFRHHSRLSLPTGESFYSIQCSFNQGQTINGPSSGNGALFTSF